MRSMPPTIIAAANAAIASPTAKGGKSNATVTAEVMELD